MDMKNLDDLLESFSLARDIEDISQASDALLSAKLINKARLDPRFERGLANCFSALNSDRPDTERLKALAIAYRLGASSKPVMVSVREHARPFLSQELPPLDLLTDGQDRYYASLSLLDAKGEWVPGFAARGIAREETAETARTTLAKRLLSTLSVADSLFLVSTEMARLTFETEKPSESAARRLRRVLAAIRPAIVAESIPPGNDLGSSLRALFISPFLKAGSPIHGPVTNGLAQECCALVFDILRTQLTVIAEPTIYRSLSPARDWIGPKMWPRFVKKNSAASSVLGTLEGAIILLAKQRITEQSLLDTLLMFVTSRDEAANHTAKLAEQNPDLEPAVRDWLARFGRVRSTSVLTSMIDAQEAASDPAIASLLVTADSLQREMSSDVDTLLFSKKARSLMERLIEEINSLASSRRLTLRLAPNDVVTYAPTAHELVGGHTLGVSKARVLRPMVEKRNSDGTASVVHKALVEPFGDSNG